MHSLLNRAVVRAMARNKVQRNVVALCSVPVGQAGRPSKSLVQAAPNGTPEQEFAIEDAGGGFVYLTGRHRILP